MNAGLGLVQVHSGPARRPSTESIAPLTEPPKALQKSKSAPAGEDIELATIRAHDNNTATVAATHNGDLEMSRPASPDVPDEATNVVQTVWQPYMNRFRLLAACIAAFTNGMNDSAAGALIPYMEKYYDIGYATVSLIFVGQALGFIIAAVFLDSLRIRLGHARLFGLSQILMTLAYVPIVSNSPFPVVVFSFLFVGYGIATNVAITNIFCGSLRNGTFMLGLLHGCYGVGGTAGPLMATAIVTVADAVWSRYYLLTMSVCGVSIALALWSFWNYDRDLQYRLPTEQTPEQQANVSARGLWSMFSSLKMRLVLLGSTFIFAYQGAEVSISGWVISFLIEEREGAPASVGYVTSGFWGGITLGRFLLAAPAQKIGEKRFVFGLVVGALAMQLLVWFVPNVIGNAVAVSIVGFLLGPVYPCAITVFLRGMSRSEALSGMGTISAFGSMGGAVAPFFTGLIAQAVDPWVLHPIVIVLFVGMLVCWYAIPSQSKRRE